MILKFFEGGKKFLVVIDIFWDEIFSVVETNYSYRLRKTLPRKQVPYACQKGWGEFQMIKHKAGFHAWEEIAVILGSTIELQIHFIQVFSITCSKLIIQIHVKSQLVGCQFPIHLMNWPIWYVWRFCSVQ